MTNLKKYDNIYLEGYKTLNEVTLLKRKYSLDYSIERDIDRVAAVIDILDSLDTDPSALELE